MSMMMMMMMTDSNGLSLGHQSLPLHLHCRSAARGLIDNSNRASSLPSVLVRFPHSTSTGLGNNEPTTTQPADQLEQQAAIKWRPLLSSRPASASETRVAWGAIDDESRRDNNQESPPGEGIAEQLVVGQKLGKISSALRSNSLDDIKTTVANSFLAADEDCFVHELADGQRIIISRGWPSDARRKPAARTSNECCDDGDAGRKSTAVGIGKHKLNEEERNRLLMEYLSRSGQKEAHRRFEQRTGNKRHKQVAAVGASPRAKREKEQLGREELGGGESQRLGSQAERQQQQPKRGSSKARALGANNKAMIVHYELPVHRSSELIPLTTSGC